MTVCSLAPLVPVGNSFTDSLYALERLRYEA